MYHLDVTNSPSNIHRKKPIALVYEPIIRKNSDAP